MDRIGGADSDNDDDDDGDYGLPTRIERRINRKANEFVIAIRAARQFGTVFLVWYALVRHGRRVRSIRRFWHLRRFQ